jgi:DNA polymerase
METVAVTGELMDELFIDFESFWGTKYSLRSPGMSYTDYICDDKFQVHGVAVILNRGAPDFMRPDEFEDFLKSFFLRPEQRRRKVKVICHNVLFDGAILRLLFDFVADEYFCTLAMVDAMYQGGIGSGLDECMKKLLGWDAGKSDILAQIKDVRTEDITPEQWDELAKYAKSDIRATYELYTKFGICLPEEEHRIMSILLKMFCDPILEFDEKTLQEACREADAEREEMMRAALSYGATEDILRGNKTFPRFLESLDYDVPLKENKDGDLIPALAKTDEGFIDMLESKDERLAALARGRLAVKSTQAQTRAYRFWKMEKDIGKFMVAYNYARAHTWRVSGGNKINPANLKRGSKLRTCIVAPEGKVLSVCDASQIECRSTGYLAGQESLMELFREKRDPYNEMATDIFNKPIDRKGNPDHFFEGFLGKTAVLGLGFGMGGEKFQHTVERDAKQYLGMDVSFPRYEADRIVYDVYRPKNYKIEEFWKAGDKMLGAMLANSTFVWEYPNGALEVSGEENKIYFPNDTWLYYPGLSWDNGSFTYVTKRGPSYKAHYIYGAKLVENIVQKFARDITSHHMIQIAERYPVVMHTYDENIAVVPEDEADDALAWMIEIMCTPPTWAADLPLAAEGGYAKEYSK